MQSIFGNVLAGSTPEIQEQGTSVDRMNEIKIDDAKSGDLQKVTSLSTKQSAISKMGSTPLSIASTLIIPKRNQNRFEVGLEAGLFVFNTPFSASFKDQKSIDESVVQKEVLVSTQGLSLGYSLSPNFFLRSGLRVARTSIENEHFIGLFYDDAKETKAPDGTRLNEMVYNARSSYGNASGRVDISIAKDADLNKGDWIKAQITDRQEFTFLQVPLGVDYFYGANRLKWHFQGGLQWNRIASKSYNVKTNVYGSETKAIYIEEFHLDSKPSQARHFLSSYAGVGLDYQIIDNFHARLGLSYGYDFYNRTSGKLPRRYQLDQTYRVGFNYRF